MFKLRTGYFISGIATGLILFISFLTSLPDGKLHIFFCDVGQGDATYIRFPDGRDMVIDGGPNNAVIECLGRHMPFWDRHINIVAMTHPEKDHMQGLIAVLDRYRVDYFMRSDVSNTSEGYQDLQTRIESKHIPQRYVTTREQVHIGQATLRVLWPSIDQVARAGVGRASLAAHTLPADAGVLGVESAKVDNLNDYSLVFWVRFGNFDALFTGDADIRVEGGYINTPLADRTVEVLKVPHHGSKTGMNEAFAQWLRPKLAVISVGKNNYGHPTAEAIKLLQSVGTQIHRTDKEGDMEIISDGKAWDLVR